MELRRLLAAEGALFTLNESVDASGLPDNLRASVIWGDGTTTPATITDSRATSNLRFKFDYSLDTRGFFSGANQSRRTALNLAGELLLGQFTDQLSAIVPGGINGWRPNVRHPSAGNSATAPIHDLSPSLQVAKNEIIVYAGSRDFPGRIRGLGGPGGVSSFSGTTSFLNTVRSRGQSGALSDVPTDFAPSIGSISFDSASSTDWYFGLDAEGIGPGQVDFLTVAMHELTHVIGFATSASWQSNVVNGRFNGANANAAYTGSGNVPVSGGHWADGVRSQGIHEPLLAGSIQPGERTLLSALDLGALEDIGWQAPTTTVNVTASARFPDNGNYPVQVVLSGIESGEVIAERAFAEKAVTVTNENPSLEIPADQDAEAGKLFSVFNIGLISDPGFRNDLVDPATAESFTYSIDWGDGTSLDRGTAAIDSHGNRGGDPTLASFDGSHVYSSAGTKTVRVSVTDDDGGTTEDSFRINVSEPIVLQLSLNKLAINEDEGENAAMLTVSRTGAAESSPRTVQIASSDESEVRLPPTVVIPANQTSVSVPVTAVDDALLDGDVGVSLTASFQGWEPAAIDLLVKDRETLTARFSDDSISEGQEAGINLTVRRSNTDVENPLKVNIGGGVSSQIDKPTDITIPPNQREATVTLFPIDDLEHELPRLMNFMVEAAGYNEGSVSFTLLDNEPPLFQNPDDRFDVNGVGGVQASDALRIINELARRNDLHLDPSAEAPSGLFLDVNGDYLVTALDALQIVNELPNREPNGQPKMVGPVAVLASDDQDEVRFQIDVLPGAAQLF